MKDKIIEKIISIPLIKWKKFNNDPNHYAIWIVKLNGVDIYLHAEYENPGFSWIDIMGVEFTDYKINVLRDSLLQIDLDFKIKEKERIIKEIYKKLCE
jgi:hypothetical protein